MSKFVRLSAMLVAMVAITAGAISIADAQDKPKEVKKVPEKAGKVEVYKAKDGYRFRILDAEGKTIAMASKGYDKEEDVNKVLEQVKVALNNAKLDGKEEKKP